MKEKSKIDPHSYDYDRRPLSASKMMMDFMIQRKSPKVKAKDLLAVFFFYCYTGTWQKTWYPHCTVQYAAKGLGMSVASVRKAKAELIRLGLAKEVKRNIMKNGRNTLEYMMHIHYFETEKEATDLQKLYPLKNCNTTTNEALQNHETNAYLSNTLNAYQSNRKNAYSRSEHKAPSRKHDPEDIKLHGKNDPTLFPVKTGSTSKRTTILSTKELKQLRQAYKIATKLKFALAHNKWITWSPNLDIWTKSIMKLRKADINPAKFSDMLTAIQFLKEHGDETHCPKPKNAEQFAVKYPQILDAIKRSQGQLKDDSQNANNNIHDDSLCNDSNLCPESTKCHKCKKSNVRVYHVIKPGTFNESTKVCKKCYKTLKREAEKLISNVDDDEVA